MSDQTVTTAEEVRLRMALDRALHANHVLLGNIRRVLDGKQSLDEFRRWLDFGEYPKAKQS